MDAVCLSESGVVGDAAECREATDGACCDEQRQGVAGDVGEDGERHVYRLWSEMPVTTGCVCSLLKEFAFEVGHRPSFRDDGLDEGGARLVGVADGRIGAESSGVPGRVCRLRRSKTFVLRRELTVRKGSASKMALGRNMATLLTKAVNCGAIHVVGWICLGATYLWKTRN